MIFSKNQRVVTIEIMMNMISVLFFRHQTRYTPKDNEDFKDIEDLLMTISQKPNDEI